MRELLLLCLLACNGKDEPIDEGDDGGDDDEEETGPECATDNDCDLHEICEAEECDDGDRNNGADEAESVEINGSSAENAINPGGDVDYFTFSAEGGEYLRITVVTAEDLADVFDTVATLLDPSGEPLLAVDDYPTGGSVGSADSVLYVYVPEPGEYTLVVEDIATYGDDDYTYTVNVEEWGAFTSEDDSAEDPSFEVDINDANVYQAIGVLLEEPGDVDYVDVEFPFDASRIRIYSQLDLSASDAQPSVRLIDEAGQTVVDNLVGGEEGAAFYPQMQDQNYRLEITDAEGGGGERHWFYVFLIFDEEDTAYPLEVEDNGSPFLATPLETAELENSDGAKYTFSSGAGYADAPLGELLQDEDWFAVTSLYDGFLVTCLNSEIYGSTVTPDIAIYDSDGAIELESESGDDDDYPTAAIENVPVSKGETYYLRVLHPEGESGLTAWYEFTLFVASFKVTGGYGCPP